MDVPSQMCKHTDSFGHPADHDIRTCPECDMRSVDHGQTWISFEEYKKKYCREESQAPPVTEQELTAVRLLAKLRVKHDALSLAADGLAEALRSLKQLLMSDGEYAVTRKNGEMMGLGDAMLVGQAFENGDAALATYEAAKESR